MVLKVLLVLLILMLIVGAVLVSSVYVVRQQSVAIIERFGKYQKLSNSGIHLRAPFGIDKIAARVQLRLLQSEIVVETKTQDNVFVTMNVATQYRVNELNVTDAYYKLMRPEAQIKSYIEDALRSSVPKLTLDELFEKKDEIALEVQKQVAEDIVKGYREFIKDIYAAGCRNLQLDDCSWGMVVDPSAPVLFGTTKAGLEKIKEQLLDVNNKAIEGAPKDLVINTHVCRGNFHSTYASSGAYDSVAETLFAKENVNAYYLEFDDERSGGFECLQKVSGDKKVVLGLITTKSPKLEDKQKVINRIHEAAKYVPLERLYLSPQCGFASCEIGNKLTEKQQWAKLALVKEIAQEVWGE